MAYKVYAPAENSVLQLGVEELISYGKGAFVKCSVSEESDILLVSEESSKFKDSFSLSSEDHRLYIRGSNSRSVLYGIFD